MKIKELRIGDKFTNNNYLYIYELVDKKYFYSENCDRFYCKCLTDGIIYTVYDKELPVILINRAKNIVENNIESNNTKNCDSEKISNIVANSPDKKLKLYLGCFNKPIPHWVNVDVRPYPETLCDITDDILKLEKFEDLSVDTILSVHTLEHVGRYEYANALKVWFNKLKKGGTCYISVPDMQAVCEHYIYHHDLSFLYSFIWGSQKHEADKHFCGFDFDLLKKSLEEVGFGNVERYDWTKTPWAYIDSYAGAYAKHLDRNSRLMSLNVKAIKS